MALRDCGYFDCKEIPRTAKMPVYKGTEPSVEFQSTEAFKGCAGVAQGETLVMQIVKIAKCLGNVCESSK